MKKIALLLSLTLTLVMLSPLSPQTGLQKVSAEPIAPTGDRYIISYDAQNTNSSSVIDAVTRAGGSVVNDHSQISTLIRAGSFANFYFAVAMSAFKSSCYNLAVASCAD